jgi:hypothetical protein
MQRRWSSPLVTVLILVCGVTVAADTLILRNGTRVSGRLVAVRNGVIEFEEDRGFGTRTVRVDQDEVRAIEFDSSRNSADNGVSTQRPRGMRERELDVSARMPWTDTGIQVRNGQTLYFSAGGEVRWGRDRRDGPEGESGSPRNPSRPIPSRPGAALIGRVGDEAPFFIGADEGPIRVRGSGPLYLGINDDTFDDNSGAFKVTIYH